MGGSPAFVFVFPSVLNGRVLDGFDYHLGTGYLRAYLAAHDVESVQFLGDAKKPVADVAAEILSLEAALVGFSCYDANYHIVRLLAEEVRRQAPHIPIILGGPSATFSDTKILHDCLAIDICCRSYAEETALDLARWSRGEIELSGIAGISYRAGTKLMRNDDRNDRPKARADDAKGAVIFDQIERGFVDTGGTLDVYPDPYMAGYLPATRVSDIGMVTSRGCTYACTFCNFSAMSGWGVATHSLTRTLEIFDFLDSAMSRRDRKTLVTINDDNFSLQGKRFHALLAEMAGRSYEHLEFWAEMRTEPLKNETFGQLRAAGFAEINFGLESAVPHVLAAMKKVRSTGWERDNFEKERKYLERIAWAVKSARSANVRTTVSAIFGAPLETIEDGQQTLDFIQEIGVDSYAHNFMVVGDGTELADNHRQFGLSNETPSHRILPPVTRTAYDVYQLPILEHDRSWLPMSGMEMRQASLLFSGIGQLPGQRARPRKNGRGGSGRTDLISQNQSGQSGPVVSVAEASVTQDVFRWLALAMPMNHSLWLSHSSAGGKSDADHLIALHRVSVPELNTLRMTTRSDDVAVYRVSEFSRNAPDENTRHLAFVSLHALLAGDPEIPPRSTVVFETDDPRDVSALKALAPLTGFDGRWLITQKFAATRLTARDNCRWCSSGCPASRLERLIVREDSTVRTCHSGDAIGSVGDSMDVLTARTTDLTSAMQIERGCATCSVQDTCAKCLFTGPLSAAEYCTIQTSKPALRAFFDGLAGLQGLRDSETLANEHGDIVLYSLVEMDGTITGADRVIPLNRCVMIVPSTGAKTFLYSHQDALFMHLPQEEGLALLSLLRFPPPGDESNSRNLSATGFKSLSGSPLSQNTGLEAAAH